MKALVVGGGIGGLTAAHALQRAGVNVALFEREARIRGEGAGISLWPNATRVLLRLGLRHIVEGQAARPFTGGLRTWRGRQLSLGTSELLESRFGAPTMIIHRAALIDALHEVLGDGVVHCGAAAKSFEQDARGVRLTLEDGRAVEGEFLVAADGIHSALRPQLGDAAGPVYAGYTAWRGVMQLADSGVAESGDHWGVYLGRGAEVGLAPMAHGQVYWYATRNAAAGCQASARGHKDDVLARLRGWSDPVERIVAATPADAVLRNDILHMEPLGTWGRDRVTLLGDAAHAMTPNLGQGGCMAIEDAAVLSACLEGATDVAAALRRYESRRMPRTSRVVRQSRRAGRMLQLENPLLCALRNTAIHLTPANWQISQLDWLLGEEV